MKCEGGLGVRRGSRRTDTFNGSFGTLARSEGVADFRTMTRGKGKWIGRGRTTSLPEESAGYRRPLKLLG